jgi:hypothetical protein
MLDEPIESKAGDVGAVLVAVFLKLLTTGLQARRLPKHRGESRVAPRTSMLETAIGESSRAMPSATASGEENFIAFLG